MPVINGRCYSNPRYGEAVEHARSMGSPSPVAPQPIQGWSTPESHGRQLSPNGLAFIARHEALPDGEPALKVYKDSAGNPTIGYGHKLLPGENFPRGITRAQALALLSRDAGQAVSTVNSALKAPVDQNQFDALVDFTYNLGARNLAKSSLLSNINSVQNVTPEDFGEWDFADGRVVRGLANRRSDEYSLFSRGIYGVPREQLAGRPRPSMPWGVGDKGRQP